MITTQDILDAFDSLGGNVNQVQALREHLQKRFPSDEVVPAINKALDDRALELVDRTGAVRKVDGN